jgi:eukaryotic-like serine/threonine-protein kinase
MEPGAVIGERFELEHQIGSGGMGRVFRARDRATGDAVAVKILAEAHERHLARFARESEVLAELTHPGIVRHVAHGTMPSGELFLAMELLDGEDLESRLARAPLTTGESIQLATRAAEALGAAHARGIVHRDLKPSNLFLLGGGVDQVKVLDFGIARREGRTQLTQTGMLIGSPGYIAPEQARCSGAIDARADVFALGCVLFLCLTGVPAFDGDSAVGILAKILFSEAPRVSTLWAGVPEDLDALVARMLAREPALRPSDGAHLAGALAALGPLARGTGTPPQERPVPAAASTSGERRFLAAVLLERATAKDKDIEGAEGAAGAELDEPEGALRRASQTYGGHLEPLVDGSTIVVLEAERRVATDLAAQAARCALALRAVAGRRRMALAMGRADATSTLPYGDAIDRAARLLAHAAGTPPPEPPPPIALDEVSAGLLDARFEVTEREAGLALHGERPLLQGARTLLGRPTACVGRDWELAALAGILDECIEEAEARAVVVTAAAGMGKSRLATEFVARVRERGQEVAIWMGRADSLRAGSTLDLLAQALRDALGVHDGAPLAERRDQIRARVAERLSAAEQQRVAEFLGELVGVPFSNGDAGSAQLAAARRDAQLMSEQLGRAWLDFLDAETAVQPVLLVLEDLHWGDFGTVRFLDTALRDRGKRPWMVLALARPEVFEVFPRLWADRKHVQQIRLKELGKKAAERLVRQVLGDSAGTDTIERLVTLADGNAFYLEELIRAVAEGKGKGKGKAGALPETVLAMVEARLAQLALEARRVLRAASVFGEVFWEGGIVSLMGGVMDPTSVAEWLARLVEQEMLAVRPHSRFPGERELAFRHALLREGAYASFTEEDRRLEHRRAGAWLEQHGEGDPMVLAGHFEHGGEGARAASYYLRAAEQAFLVLDHTAAMARIDLGLACAPPEEPRLALLGLRCEIGGRVLQLIGDVMPDAEALLRTTPRGSLPWAQAMVAYLQGTLVTGRIGDFHAAVEQLRAVEPAPEALARIALAFLIGGVTLANLGQVPAANALEEQFSAIVSRAGDHELLARYWWNVLQAERAYHLQEAPWRTFQHAGTLAVIADVTGGEVYAVGGKLLRGIGLWCLGAFADAECVLAGLAAADTTQSLGSALRRFALAWIYADRGVLDTARVLAAELAEHGHAHHNPLQESRGRWALGEVLRRTGDLDGADRELAVALAMAVPLERPGVLASLAQLRLAQGRAADARTAAEDAFARAEAMGGCGMFRGAFLRLTRAEAFHATGAFDAARAAIADARARLLAIADTIDEPAYVASFLDEVPENIRTLALARTWLSEPAPTP